MTQHSMESLLSANFVVHLLEDKLRKSGKPPAAMSVDEILEFYADTVAILENRLSTKEYSAKYGI